MFHLRLKIKDSVFEFYNKPEKKQDDLFRFETQASFCFRRKASGEVFICFLNIRIK